MSDPRSSVAVVVAGELARSPRMLNHARLLSKRSPVVLIGYGRDDVALPGTVRIKPLHPIRRARDDASSPRFLARSALRMSLLFFELVARLLKERPVSILVQNPPSFPTLAASWMAAQIVGAQLVIDWHNYGYTRLALRMGAGHPFVKLAQWYERRMGHLADAHLCVSDAMRRDLLGLQIDARVLRDCPVVIQCAEPRESSGRLLAVCPAGWTDDEDIEVLLKALRLLGSRTFRRRLEIHLTGDGPLRESYDGRIAALCAAGLDLRIGALPEAEYRALIRRADLGISLHRSTSRLDLALKVVDLFSARVPVCALNYGGSLHEQIEEGVTGFLFRDAGELAATLARLLQDPAPLCAIRNRIAERWSETWGEAWQREAAEVVLAAKR